MTTLRMLDRVGRSNTHARKLLRVWLRKCMKQHNKMALFMYLAARTRDPHVGRSNSPTSEAMA